MGHNDDSRKQAAGGTATMEEIFAGYSAPDVLNFLPYLFFSRGVLKDPAAVSSDLATILGLFAVEIGLDKAATPQDASALLTNYYEKNPVNPSLLDDFLRYTTSGQTVDMSRVHEMAKFLATNNNRFKPPDSDAPRVKAGPLARFELEAPKGSEK